MNYNKGQCLEELNSITKEKDSGNNYDKNLLDILGEDELYLKFNFNTIAQSSLYIYKLLQKCNELENEIRRYISEINNLKTGVWGSKRELQKYLISYVELSNSENALKLEINDLQKYAVTIRACIDNECLAMLISCYEKIENDSLIMFNLINMHMRDISGARVTMTNILISIVAIIVAIFLSA